MVRSTQEGTGTSTPGITLIHEAKQQQQEHGRVNMGSIQQEGEGSSGWLITGSKVCIKGQIGPGTCQTHLNGSHGSEMVIILKGMAVKGH